MIVRAFWFDLDGRLARAPFWGAVFLILFTNALLVAAARAWAGIVAAGVEGSALADAIFAAVALPVGGVLFASAVALCSLVGRRAQDRGRAASYGMTLLLATAGWTAAALLAPAGAVHTLSAAVAAGCALWLMLDLGLRRGTPDANAYGPDPRERRGSAADRFGCLHG